MCYLLLLQYVCVESAGVQIQLGTGSSNEQVSHREVCALLGIRDPAMQCKLFDTLVLLGAIVGYACESVGCES